MTLTQSVCVPLKEPDVVDADGSSDLRGSILSSYSNVDLIVAEISSKWGDWVCPATFTLRFTVLHGRPLPVVHTGVYL